MSGVSNPDRIYGEVRHLEVFGLLHADRYSSYRGMPPVTDVIPLTPSDLARHLYVSCGASTIRESRDCPHSASDELQVIEVKHKPIMLAVKCNECGATGPRSLGSDPAHAVFEWNQRMGRLSLVKG